MIGYYVQISSGLAKYNSHCLSISLSISLFVLVLVVLVSLFQAFR